MGGERRDARALRLQVLYAGLGVRDTKRLGYEKDLNRYKCRKLASDLKKKKKMVCHFKTSPFFRMSKRPNCKCPLSYMEVHITLICSCK